MTPGATHYDPGVQGTSKDGARNKQGASKEEARNKQGRMKEQARTDLQAENRAVNTLVPGGFL